MEIGWPSSPMTFTGGGKQRWRKKGIGPVGYGSEQENRRRREFPNLNARENKPEDNGEGKLWIKNKCRYCHQTRI